MIDALPYRVRVFVYHILYIHEQQQINNSSKSNSKKKNTEKYIISQLGAHKSNEIEKGNNCVDDHNDGDDDEKTAKMKRAIK